MKRSLEAAVQAHARVGIREWTEFDRALLAALETFADAHGWKRQDACVVYDRETGHAVFGRTLGDAMRSAVHRHRALLGWCVLCLLQPGKAAYEHWIIPCGIRQVVYRVATADAERDQYLKAERKAHINVSTG